MHFDDGPGSVGNRNGLHEEGVRADKFTCPTTAVNLPLPIFLDTWYATIFDEIGVMPLGIGPRREQTRMAQFVNDQLANFQVAFQTLARMRIIQLYHVSTPSSIHITGTRIPVLGSAGAWQQSLRTSLVGTAHIVIGVYVQLDINVTIRTVLHTFENRWLPFVGNLVLSSDWNRKAVENDSLRDNAVWNAKLECEVASLFRRDNSAILQHTREEWNRLRARDPNATDLPENEEPFVTLAAPPPGTPEDNMELYSVNAPRLHDAVASWEQFAGRTFRWNPNMG